MQSLMLAADLSCFLNRIWCLILILTSRKQAQLLQLWKQSYNSSPTCPGQTSSPGPTFSYFILYRKLSLHPTFCFLNTFAVSKKISQSPEGRREDHRWSAPSPSPSLHKKSGFQVSSVPPQRLCMFFTIWNQGYCLVNTGSLFCFV